jgi:hypothetical protein
MDVVSLAAVYVRKAHSLRHDRDPDGIWSHETDPDCYAYDRVHKTIQNGPAVLARALVLEVLRQTPDEDLGVQAAGPLEDVVRYHGAALVEQIEAESTTEPS